MTSAPPFRQRWNRRLAWRLVVPPWRWPLFSPCTDAVVRTEPRPVPFQAEEAQQPARSVYHGQPAPAVVQKRLPRSRDGLRWRHRATDKCAELRGASGDGRGFGKVRSFYGRDEPPVSGNDQGHMNMVVLEALSDRLRPALRSVRLRGRHHDIGNKVARAALWRDSKGHERSAKPPRR